MATTAPNPWDELIERCNDLALLDSASSYLGWDQEVMMPEGGVAHRARQLEVLAKVAHERLVDPRFGELIVSASEDADVTSDASRAAIVRELQRRHGRAVCLPAALVAELAQVQSLAQHEWAHARKATDFARFRPWLERLVGLVRRKAEYLGPPAGGELWDALADDFEPGLRAADVRGLFDAIHPRLRALVAAHAEGASSPDAAVHDVVVPVGHQVRFVRFVAAALGFDFEAGRLDSSTHPFCEGAFPGDVRITTRYTDDRVCDALFSTMHETGHGLYEQGLPAEHAETPLGRAPSLGLHESQSRLWENHVGRSRAFWQWCQPHFAQFLGDAVAGFDAETLFLANNVVRPSLIRVDADEATYDLHVMVRFEVETALIRGELAVADLPTRWNELYRELVGVEVPDDARGCLQDVHWSCGLFGYFPTYTLGNVWAAQIMDAARSVLSDLDAQIARGEFSVLLGWLRETVHRHGHLLPAAELVERVTGSRLDPEPFLAHLERRFGS